MKGDIETYYENGQWKNKVEGSSRAASTHDTKKDASAKGREMAKERKVEHFIRNQDRPDRRAQHLRPRSPQHPRLTTGPDSSITTTTSASGFDVQSGGFLV